MPKKFKGENSKAAAARERKAAVLHEQQEKKKKEEEDAYWADDDKHATRKLQRKEDKEKKREEQLAKKKELQKMVEDEMDSIKTTKLKTQAKVTRAQIAAEQERQRQETETAAEKEASLVHDEVPLEENVNRLVPEGDEARNVEDAITMLSMKEPDADRHPEKRMKAAYQKFEDENLPILKQENPNMRLSQLKQMLKKDWMKSPQNPLNQRVQQFNAKR